MSKLERFNANARAALTAAQRESLALNHNYVGTEHLLLGLCTSGSVAGSLLLSFGITETDVRTHVHAQIGRGERKLFDPPSLAPQVKTVIGMAAKISKHLNNNQIGTGHILLAVLDEGESTAITILQLCLDEGNSRRNLDSGQRTLTTLKQGLISRLTSSLYRVVDEQESLKQTLETLVVTRSRSMSTPLDYLAASASYENRLKWASQRAAQEERSRIARDLHDSIKQQLFNINISAAAALERWDADTDSAKAALADAQQSAQAAMVEMNAMLMQLSPEPLEKMGLIEALREQCQALAFRTGAQVNTAFGDLPPEELLPDGTQIAIFRIAQEALANVARHARADNARLRLDTLWDERAVLLEISDDGQGFEPHKIISGMGLSNMKERVGLLKGSVEIESQPGEGTTVTVMVPLVDVINGPNVQAE